MLTVFVLEHLHTHEDGEECWKRIGIYSTRNKALEAVERIKLQPGFYEHQEFINHDDPNSKNGFNLDETVIDMDHWEEGYVTEHH